MTSSGNKVQFCDLLARQAEGKRFSRFQQLMQYRVRDILMLSSPYDSFILSEEGRLNELILSEYLDHNLRYAPNITSVTSGEEALKMAQDVGRYNLIITTMHVDDMTVLQFVSRLRSQGVKTPVVLLTYNSRALSDLLHRPEMALVDKVFVWQGDFSIFLTIIKQVEDRMNVAEDSGVFGVPVLLLVEDNVGFYSSYLPMIYKEVIRHSQRLISEGLDLSQKLLRMRARPKILHCTHYEEFERHFTAHHKHLVGIISDIGFPRNGAHDNEAGLALAAQVRGMGMDIPLLLQSDNPGFDSRAKELGATFIHKRSPTLLHQVRAFMYENFSFGDFVFRMPDGREVDRASDLKSIIEKLEVIPAESLAYHAARHHFARWFQMRTELKLASDLRRQKVEDFRDVEDLRKSLVRTLKDRLKRRYRGVVVNFNPNDFETSVNIGRIGDGTIGGKARGLAFVAMLLDKYDMRFLFDGVRLFVPATVVLATGVFDDFMEQNQLADFALEEHDQAAIVERFMQAKLPNYAVQQLSYFLEGITYPLVVRSSSILEDSMGQPFAGVYDTFMAPNSDPDHGRRLTELLAAVKAVYASTYSPRAKAYMRATNYRMEEEKMAVVIQRLVGAVHGEHFYPHFSGVARSHNAYPSPPMAPGDGIVSVAVGLGKAVVEGGRTLAFCPVYPKNIMQLSSPEEALNTTQRCFYALKLQQDEPTQDIYTEANIEALPVERARQDGVLHWMGSTYCAENHCLYDGVSRPGMPVVSFANILKHHLFPLADLCRVLLQMGAYGMSMPVEIEFAADLTKREGSQEFAVLQMRPLVVNCQGQDVEIPTVTRQDLLAQSAMVLGNGRIDTIRDVVMVDVDAFDRSRSLETAREVAACNALLLREERPYLLVGVGRWGSSDPWLGIPVAWEQISGARVIVESDFLDMKVEPSQGSHFFQNLTSFQVGYFTVNRDLESHHLDWQWLMAQAPRETKTYTRMLRFEDPLVVRMAGATGRGVIYKPGKEPSRS